MARLTITTSQNVTIDYELATVMERVLAAGFDLFVQLVYILIFNSLITRMAIISAWAVLIPLAPVFLYSLIFEVFADGRTPGKMVFNTRVVRLDGRRAGFSAYFLRWLFRLADVAITAGGLAISMIFFSKNAQRTGDLAAATTVVRTKIRPVYNPLFQFVPPNYTIRYEQARLLSEDDVRILGDLLSHYRKLGTSFKMNKIMQDTRNRLIAMLNIEPQERNDVLIQTLLTDYSAINRQKTETADTGVIPVI